MRAGERAWLGLAGYVLAWNACCRDGETLSEAADDWHPILTTAGAFAIAAHIANRIPERVDIVHWAHLGIRAARRKLLT